MSQPPPLPPLPPPRRPKTATPTPPEVPPTIAPTESPVVPSAASLLPYPLVPPPESPAPPLPATATETPTAVPVPIPTPIPVTTVIEAPTPTVQSPIAAAIFSATSTSIAIAALGAPVITTSATTPIPSTVQTVPAKNVNRRSNLKGFEDGNWYKVRNVGDNSVIQLDSSNKFVCMPEDDGKLDLQLFRTAQQANGTFRIMAKLQKTPDNIQVWDYLPHRGLLLQRKQSPTDKYQQNWKSEAVTGFNSLYLIQSGASPDAQFCLKNMGIGEPIQLITKDAKVDADNFTHWYLEIQD